MAWHGSISFPTVWLTLSIVSAAVVACDVTMGAHRQPMAVMSVAWPLTVLYWGPVGLFFYYRFGRSNPGVKRESPPMWWATFLGATHCGAGCALGDFIGEWLVFALSIRIAGSEPAARLATAFILAYLFGVAFQYFSIAPMRGLGFRDGIVAAVKADTLSLLAYELGMFGCMIALAPLFHPSKPTHASYWVFMQGAMIAGFVTTYPVNYWLIRRGIKEKM